MCIVGLHGEPFVPQCVPYSPMARRKAYAVRKRPLPQRWMEKMKMGGLTYAELRRLARTLRDDDCAAREHLAAGRWIVYREANTPPGHVIRRYPDGRCELVCYVAGEASVVRERIPVKPSNGRDH